MEWLMENLEFVIVLLIVSNIVLVVFVSAMCWCMGKMEDDIRLLKRKQTR